MKLEPSKQAAFEPHSLPELLKSEFFGRVFDIGMLDQQFIGGVSGNDMKNLKEKLQKQDSAFTDQEIALMKMILKNNVVTRSVTLLIQQMIAKGSNNNFFFKTINNGKSPYETFCTTLINFMGTHERDDTSAVREKIISVISFPSN